MKVNRLVKYHAWGLYLLLTSALMMSCTSLQEGASQSQSYIEPAKDFGVIVMAHGGSVEWNQSVENSLAHLETLYPVEIAFGMADAESLESAVRRLEAKQVKQAGVVRLFVSGESWYERTSQILGIEEGAPEKPFSHQTTSHGAMSMGYWKIDTNIHFNLSTQGLAEAQEMDQVLLSRVQEMSSNPASEVVAIIAHGPADDEENERWISEIGERARLLQQQLRISDVRVFTLREDWEQKRENAEEQIRAYIKEADASGLTAMVVPYRVQGFGPYADVLDGLNYIADQKGLTPHANVALWVQNQAEELRILAELEMGLEMGSE